MSKEYVILKGVSDRYTGYATNTMLSSDANYIEYKGLFYEVEHQVSSQIETIDFSNNYRRSNVVLRPKVLIRSLWFGYPATAINYEDYWNDDDDNNLYDLLNSEFVWICNDHVINESDTRLNLVPITETDYLTKNRLVVINSIEVVKDNDFHHHLELTLEYADV